jgi:hypothetical protein
MLTINHEGHELKMYNSAEELPIKRYSKFQRYNILESGVGSDIESIGSHFGKMFEFLNYKMNEEALQEAKNLYYNFFLILQEVNLPGLAFCCLLHSIDGEPLYDLSEDNLKAVCDRLDKIGITQASIVTHSSEVKKKSTLN